MERGLKKKGYKAVLLARRELRFRTRMQVTEKVLYMSGEAFPICPRCGVSVERDYQEFCDRCGQRLGWERFSSASVVVKF